MGVIEKTSCRKMALGYGWAGRERERERGVGGGISST